MLNKLSKYKQRRINKLRIVNWAPKNIGTWALRGLDDELCFINKFSGHIRIPAN